MDRITDGRMNSSGVASEGVGVESSMASFDVKAVPEARLRCSGKCAVYSAVLKFA